MAGIERQKAEGRRRKAEGRRQKAEGGRREAEGRRREAAKNKGPQGEPHRAIGVSAKRGRHLSEQAFDTYHVLLYGVPLGVLVFRNS